VRKLDSTLKRPRPIVYNLRSQAALASSVMRGVVGRTATTWSVQCTGKSTIQRGDAKATLYAYKVKYMNKKEFYTQLKII